MNKSDSERVRTVIEGMGYSWTDTEEEAELLGVIACSVRQKSIDKVYSKISRWNKWKNHRSVLTFISGCILPSDRGKFLKLFDLLFTMAELPELPDMIRQYGVVVHHAPVLRDKEAIRDFWMVRPLYNSDYEAFIPIQNGCDKFCSFCAVPYTRGREISRPSKEIMEELRQLVDSGYKTITLLGQNVNSYGLDRQGSELSFAALLRQIGEFGKNSGREFWVYFTSPHPRDMSDDVLETIATYRCLAKQIHLPLQSGDDKVLIRMNRKHSLADYSRIVDSIRRLLPSATLFTDIIVGFSGETNEQFENTRKAIETFRFNMAYIAAYSPRPGAASSRWKDDITAHEKKNRLHVLTEELTRHTLEYNRQFMGKCIRVLVTGYDRKPGYLSGLTEGRIVVRFADDRIVLPGDFIWFEVTGAAPYSLEGRRVPENVLEQVLS
jgi:tRNA-2-methylthio-N6-dimethylallyladenosine synthase